MLAKAVKRFIEAESLHTIQGRNFVVSTGPFNSDVRSNAMV